MQQHKNIKYDFTIIGEITDYTLSEFLKCSQDKRKLTILIHTQGGNGEAAMYIKKHIELNNIKVTAYCSKVESAGMVILAGCSKKIAFDYTSFMMHEGKTYYTGLINQHKRKVDLFNEIIYTKLYPTVKRTKHCLYLTSQEMLDLKLIDEII